MPGITFPAARADQPVGLLDLLRLLGERGRNSVWLLKNLEVAPSSSADGLHDASDQGLWVPGMELLELAAGYTQVIDGELIAHDSPDDPPWVMLRAVDGTEWDVYSEDESLLSQIAAGVPDARPIPE
jgi:hypothetical protein